MRNFLVALFLLLNMNFGAVAQAVAPADETQFHTVISNQLEAFKAGNDGLAYSFAAPMVQQVFPNAETFMAMVQRGYPMMLHNQGYEFGTLGHDQLGRAIQQVKITGSDGEHYVASYAMQQQPDGSWKIAACTLMKIEGVGV
jgi:hypothetical protein